MKHIVTATVLAVAWMLGVAGAADGANVERMETAPEAPVEPAATPPDTIIRSTRWPPVGVAVDAAFRYLGTRTTDLGSAEAEIHVLADVDADGRLQRFYWIQFEGRKPGTRGRYDYSNLPHVVTVDGYGFDADVRYGAYTESEVRDEQDTRTVGEILVAHGFDFPAPMMRVRMATLDEEARNELLVIYMERLSWSGLTPEELDADPARWEQIAAALRARAAAGLVLVAE